MKYQHLITLFGSSIFFVFAASVQAQTMYRCGSVYQDRPCENGQQGKVIGVNRSPAAGDKPALDLSCTRRGEEAKKIIWSREGGASADKLMAEASTSERRKLIADVYAIRGNSSDVRAAIENDCTAEKVKAKQNGYLPDEDGPGSAPAPARSAERKISSSGDTEKRVDTLAAESAAARKRVHCENLKSQLAIIRGDQRAGGSSNTMNNLNQQKSEMESALKSAGCDGTQGSMQMH